MFKNIVSICPATGWWVGYKDPDGSATFHPLAVFAALQTPAQDEDNNDVLTEEIVGMDALDLANFGVANQTENFCGYYHESDFETLGYVLTGRAEKRFNGGGY